MKNEITNILLSSAACLAVLGCGPPDVSSMDDGIESRTGALHADIVDFPPGNQCFGMHCCPPGHGVRGFHRDRNELLCRQLVETEEDCFIDGPTTRENVKACPVGTYVKGIHADKNLLTCCFSRRRGFSELNNETIDDGVNQAFNMHACPASSTQDGFLTGLDVATNKFLCAKAPTTPSTISNPVVIGMDPFQPKTFSSFFPAVSHGTWQRAVRNWLSRVFNLPVNGAQLQVPAVTVVGADVTDEGIRRRKITYPSLVDGVPIPAYLLFPSGFSSGGSFPAVVFTHGHGSNKTSTAIDWNSGDHAGAKLLAQKGFVVIAADTRSFNDYTINGLDHVSYTNSLVAATGHDGRIAQMWAVDLMRNLTVLLSTQGVDKNRVHVAGLSLGSWQATYLAALDTRITGKVIAGSLLWSLACLNEPQRLGHERCQGIHGLSASQDHPGDSLLFDTGELAALIAPRPLYAAWGSLDTLGQSPNNVPGTSKTCAQDGRERAQATYNLLNIGGSFRFGDVTTGVMIPGMDHEFDNPNAIKFLTNATQVDQIDYGTQCGDMHCCPPGKVIRGYSSVRNDFVCGNVITPANESCTEAGVQRSGMLACPVGTWAKGFHAGRNTLLCCFDRTLGPVIFSNEATDPASISGSRLRVQGIHVCPSNRPMLVGLHVGNDQYLCTAR